MRKIELVVFEGDDIELSPVEIAKALSAAARIRSGDSPTTSPRKISTPTSLSEALAEAVSLGAGILGRGRRNPFAPGQADSSSTPGALAELAQFNAAVLVTTDFLCQTSSISSASIAFGVRAKAVDVVESFIAIERSLMLLAGVIPLAAALDAAHVSEDDLASSRAVVLAALEWGISEYAAIAQTSSLVAAAA